MKRAWLICLVAGCASSPLEMHPWPRRPVATSGVLFKLSADLDMNGYYVSMVRIGFSRPQEKNTQTWNDFQHVDVDGDEINKFPNDIVLVPLQPGEYTWCGLKVLFSRNEVHSLDKNVEGAFSHFVVEPGKVTVLGTLDVNAVIKVTNAKADGSQDFQGEISVRTAADDGTRLELVEMAMMRPEGERTAWGAALESAHEAVYARVRAAALAKREAQQKQQEAEAEARAKAEAEARAKAEAEAKPKAEAEAQPASAETQAPPPSPTPVVASAPPVLVASAGAQPAMSPLATTSAEPEALVAAPSERLGFTLEVGMGAGMAAFNRSNGIMNISQSGPGPALDLFLGVHVSQNTALGVRTDLVGIFNDQIKGTTYIVGGDASHWFGERTVLDVALGAGVRQTGPKDGGETVSATGFGMHAGLGYDVVHGRHSALQLTLSLGYAMTDGSLEQFAGGLAYHLY